jgi:AhpC/TSA antioxidant enzyme
MNYYTILDRVERQRVSDGAIVPVLSGCKSFERLLVLVWPQLGDFDSIEYAWWLQRESKRLQSKGLAIRAIGIGSRTAGERFCNYTGFPSECLFIDPNAQLHRQIGLYSGLSFKLPGFSTTQNAWINLILMCAGIGSPGTLAEVFRGYLGDRRAPQLLDDEKIVRAFPLPPFKGNFFNLAGGKGFQRPFELATLRLANMVEVLSHWNIYLSDAAHLTQRGGTFLFDAQGKLLYEHRDRGILGFAADMSRPLSFLLEQQEIGESVNQPVEGWEK